MYSPTSNTYLPSVNRDYIQRSRDSHATQMKILPGAKAIPAASPQSMAVTWAAPPDDVCPDDIGPEAQFH